MLPKLKEFISHVREKGILIIYSRHIENKELVQDNTRYLFGKKNFDFNSFQKDQTGSQIYYLQPPQSDIVLNKVTWDIFSNSKLEEILKSKGIKNLIITGVNTECCVFSTVSSAYMKGYNVFIPEELISTKDNKIKTYHQTILSLIDMYYGFVMNLLEASLEEVHSVYRNLLTNRPVY